MYTILVKPDDTLVATHPENIYHKTSMVHKLRFLVDPITTKNGEEIDLRTCICTLEYRTPISQEYVPLILHPSAELYKEKLEYLIPIDTAITAEVGVVEMYIGWKRVTINSDGTFNEYSRATESIDVEIKAKANWSDYVASANLDMLTQVLLKNQAQNEEMKQYADQLQQIAQYNAIMKADNMKTFEDENGNKILQLESMGSPIGQPVTLEDCNCEEGVPVVDFTVIDPDDGTNESKEVDNVVEF